MRIDLHNHRICDRWLRASKGKPSAFIGNLARPPCSVKFCCDLPVRGEGRGERE